MRMWTLPPAIALALLVLPRPATGAGRDVSWLAIACDDARPCPAAHSCQPPSDPLPSDNLCQCAYCADPADCPPCACPECEEDHGPCTDVVPERICRYDGFNCEGAASCPEGFGCEEKTEGCGSTTGGGGCIGAGCSDEEPSAPVVTEDEDCTVLWTYCFPGLWSCAADADCPPEWTCAGGLCEARGWEWEQYRSEPGGADGAGAPEGAQPWSGAAGGEEGAGCAAAATGPAAAPLLAVLLLLLAAATGALRRRRSRR